jgi:hypothetical protein
MSSLSTFGREGLRQLGEQAEQLEQLAAFMSRPDGRMHIMERAAEFRAKAALIQAARGDCEGGADGLELLSSSATG